MSKKWTNTARVINAPDIESTADGVYLTAEQMDAIETSVATPAQEQLSADLSAANASLQTANNRIAELEKEVKTLQVKPGAAPAAVQTAVDKVAATDNGKKDRVKSEVEQNVENYTAIRKHDWSKPIED